jgi:hypothetical protein
MSAALRRRFQRARVFVLAGSVLALGVAAPLAVAEAQLEVDELEVFIASVGRERSASFRVRNTSAAPVTARLGVADWSRQSDGTNEFVDAGTVLGACADKVSIFPQLASLAPGESQVVRVSYTGDSLRTMCWAAVMVGVAPGAAQSTGGAGIAAEIRSAVKVYVNPVVTDLAVRVEDIDVGTHRPTLGESAADTIGTDVIARLRNHGNVQVRAKVRVEYRSVADSVVARAEDDDVPMLPGTERLWRTKIPALAPGRYVVLVVVDFGGTELVAGQLELELTP